MEEELDLSLDEGYAIFKEEHDSSTLEPIYDKSFALSKELHDTTHMDPYHDENSALFYHLGELVHSPTSYNSIFCSIHPNEVWVKGFFLMVPHEEHGHYISPFDDGIIRAPSYLHFQQHPSFTL